MQHEGRRSGKSVDLVDSSAQCAQDISVRGFVETDVAVTDLYEAEFAFELVMRRIFHIAERERLYDTALYNQQRARSSPGHAFQESAAVDAVARVVMCYVVVIGVLHKSLHSRDGTGAEAKNSQNLWAKKYFARRE